MAGLFYVVMGETGEYEDRNEWIVVAYASRRLALQHARRAKERADALFAAYGGTRTLADPKDGEHYNAFDPWMKLDGCAGYCVVSVELRDGLPTSGAPMRRPRRPR